MSNKDEQNLAIQLIKKRMNEKEEQSIAIKFCHEHKLLMIPVETYHKLNVAYYAFQNGMTYEEAEKAIVRESV
jgi:hypothetical protein